MKSEPSSTSAGIAFGSRSMFEPLRDVGYFARVTVDAELGTIVWPNGADVAPDVLHEQAMSLA